MFDFLARDVVRGLMVSVIKLGLQYELMWEG